jgi:hypothetical protein
MLKKILIIGVSSAVALALVVFVIKDALVARYAARAIEQSLGARCSIGKARLGLRSCELYDIDVRTAAARLTVKHANVRLDLSWPLGIRSLSLQDSTFDIQAPQGVHASAKFSASGTLDRKQFLLDDLAIVTLDLESKDAGIRRLSCRRTGSQKFAIIIPTLALKNKEFKDIRLALQLEPHKITLSSGNHILFGKDATVILALDYADWNNVCLGVDTHNFSFDSVVSLLNDKDEIEFHGLFSGQLTLCGTAQGLRDTSGRLVNQSGGVIRVKNEHALDFLRPHLDERSFKALVDNFKNYSYNNGEISLTRDSDNVSVVTHFVSPKLGTRNIGVVLNGVIRREP